MPVLLNRHFVVPELDRCRADDMVVALQQWFVIFGIVPNWMSDQGPHYKNQVTEKLRRIYGAAHLFFPAHCPWSNGTVEVMMRSIRKTIQAMRVELRVNEDAVDCLLPVVQHALNHTPSPNLTLSQRPKPSNWMLATMSWLAACHGAARSFKSDGLAPAGSSKPSRTGSSWLKICSTVNSPPIMLAA